jgi:hypothetical protein
MSGVSNGQVANETTFDNSFMARNGDTSTIGKVGLLNADTLSGATTDNAQRELNSEASYSGRTMGAVKDVTPTWTDASVGSGADDLTERAEALTAEFNPASGHTHDGSDSALISAVDLANVRLRGYLVQGTNLLAVTGTSLVVTTQLTGKTPSTNTTTKGVVVASTNNQVVLRDKNTTDDIVSPAGDRVYGRITESAGVWTLSFYTDIAGVETAFALSAQDVSWFYEELFSPTVDAPVYSDLKNIPSDNATQDVVDASATQRGLVNTSAQSWTGIKNFLTGIISALTTLKHITTPANPAAGFVSVYPKADNKLYILTSAGLETAVGTGGGGGSAVQWVESLDAPESAIDLNLSTYKFPDGLTQALYALVKVPTSYVAGSPIKMLVTPYSYDAATSTMLINAISTLIRSGVDALDSTTNQRTTTNTAIAIGAATVKIPQAATLDLTSAIGQINGVAVAAGDLIQVQLQRDFANDTSTNDVFVPVYGAEVTFS